MTSPLPLPMCRALYAVLAILAGPAAARAGTYFVDFEEGGKPAYTNAEVVLSGLPWSLDNALTGDLAGDRRNGAWSARMRHETAHPAVMTMKADKAGGIGTLSLLYARYGNDSGAPTLVAEYSTDGGTNWLPAGDPFSTDGVTALTAFSVAVSEPRSARIRVRSVSGNSGTRANLDDIILTDYGSVLSNRPPAITPIRPQAVLLHAELRFNVEAADPVDRDAVALWAADVPPGATFSAVTNAGAVTNAFVWTHAGPVGSYATTFFAADKDGTNSQTVALRVNPPPPSNQSVVVHFNEIRFNDDGTDDAEFLELVAPAGTNLQDCYLVHYNGDDGSDGGLWTFRFPACTVPDDGVTDVQGGPLGFVVLSQPGAAVPNSDFELPLDPASGASLQNGADGVVLYDPSGNILDAVAWPEFGFSDPGDLPLDDPGTVTTEGRPENPNFLHLIPYSRDDSSLQAPDNVVSNSGSLWLPLPSTPGLINGSQTSGALILTPYAAPPPLPLNGPVLLIR